MNAWAFTAGFLAGWILGVWMSHRKIRQQEQQRQRLNELGRELAKALEDAEEVVIKISEDQRANLEKLTPAQVAALFSDKTKH